MTTSPATSCSFIKERAAGNPLLRHGFYGAN